VLLARALEQALSHSRHLLAGDKLAQADRLAANQLARLLEGPPDLGLASFTHPPKRRRRPCFSREGLGDEAFLKFLIFGGNVVRREGRLRSAPKRLDATSE
jgi:hypothetical protein